MSRTRVHYRGRVQGVGFRVTARSIAQRQPVTGWVQNEPDGSVLFEAQGPPEAVAATLDAIRERMGPRITGEAATDVPVVEGESSFVIRS